MEEILEELKSAIRTELPYMSYDATLNIKNREWNDALHFAIKKLESLKAHTDKVVIPQFVADLIECYKSAGNSLGELLAHIEYEDVLKIKLKMLSKVVEWVYPDDFSDSEDRIDLLAKAWLDGYTIEKEPQWVVKDDTGYLSYLQFSIPDIYELETSLDKNDAYKFNSKSKADLIADLVNGTAEEVTE